MRGRAYVSTARVSAVPKLISWSIRAVAAFKVCLENESSTCQASCFKVCERYIPRIIGRWILFECCGSEQSAGNHHLLPPGQGRMQHGECDRRLRAVVRKINRVLRTGPYGPNKDSQPHLIPSTLGCTRTKRAEVGEDGGDKLARRVVRQQTQQTDDYLPALREVNR